MKFNWGTGIVITFGAFIVFILFFVVKTFTNNKYSYDLVSEAYYEDEIAFQKKIDDTKNVDYLTEKMIINTTEESIEIMIPTLVNDEPIGKIQFYRPSNQKLDFERIIFSNNSIFYYKNEPGLIKGRWNVIVTWHYKSNPSKEFYKKQELYI